MKKAVLCSYHYDPLDRLTGTTPALQSGSLRFYCQSRIATEIQGGTQHSIIQHGDQLLAQQTHQADQHTSTLLITDSQRSVLHTVNDHEQRGIAYSPFGHTMATYTHPLLNFNGERCEPTTGHYLLGHGYRAFNPVLMRFNSPDSWSPFGAGGINAYVYCASNPILQQDPTGHVLSSLTKLAPTVPPRPLASLKSRKTIAGSQTPPSKPFKQTTIQRRHSDVTDLHGADKRRTTNSSTTHHETNELVAYHGSTAQHKNSLEAGLNAKYMGTRNGIDSGRGFYTTPDYKSALSWARVSKRVETGSPQVFGVYTHNFHNLKRGRDYTMNTELDAALKEHVQIIFKESAYPMLSIRAVSGQQRRVRTESFTAPF